MIRKFAPYAILGLAGLGAWYFLIRPASPGGSYLWDSTFSTGVKDLFRGEGGSAGAAAAAQREQQAI